MKQSELSQQCHNVCTADYGLFFVGCLNVYSIFFFLLIIPICNTCFETYYYAYKNVIGYNYSKCIRS